MNIKNLTESAGGIVLGIDKKFVLVNQNHDSWSLPKGHIDPGENALDAAKREIYEESVIKKLKFVKKLGHYERYKIGLDGKDDHSELKRIHLFLFCTFLFSLYFFKFFSRFFSFNFKILEFFSNSSRNILELSQHF